MTARIPSLALAAAFLAAPLVASDHRDAPLVSEDPTLDLADLYVFPSPADPARLVVAVTSAPFTTPGVPASFSPFGLYEFRIDHTGDAVEDLVVQATFRGTGGEQKVEVRGPAPVKKPGGSPRPLPGPAPLAGPVGEVLEADDGSKAFAGPRDDPFFFDNQAFFAAQRFRSPGVDFYAGLNVVALVVELPFSRVSPAGAPVRVWATASRRVGSKWFQQDRLGLPAVNVVLVPSSARDDYNLSAPRDDPRDFLAGLDETLQALGIEDAAARAALGSALLPDVLTYDPARPAGFLNGRRPADDVIDAVLGLLAARGAAVPTDPAGKPSDNVAANDVAFLPSFPYLAAPHPAR